MKTFKFKFCRCTFIGGPNNRRSVYMDSSVERYTLKGNTPLSTHVYYRQGESVFLYLGLVKINNTPITRIPPRVLAG
jgi:hypothetical protein